MSFAPKGFGVGRGIPRQSATSNPAASSTSASATTPGTGRGSPRKAVESQQPTASSQPKDQSAVGAQRPAGVFDESSSTYRAPSKWRSEPKTVDLDGTVQKKGNLGKEVVLSTNYFRVGNEPQIRMAYYRITFDPAIPDAGTRRLVLKSWPLMPEVHFYDGRAALILPVLHFHADAKELEDDITHGGKQYKIRVKFQNFLSSQNEADLGRIRGIFHQHILKEVMKNQECTKIGGGYFFKKDRKQILGVRSVSDLFVMPGYHPNLSLFEAGILLNVDLLNRFQYKASVLDIICHQSVRKGNCALGSREHCEEATRLLKGMVVVTTYNDKAYKVIEVKSREEVDQEFEHQGMKTSIDQYMKKTYNLAPTNNQQPYIMGEAITEHDVPKRLRRTVPLLPEFCLLTGILADCRTSFSNMARILDSIRYNPEKRAELTRRFISTLNSHGKSQQLLKEWGIQLEQELMKVHGRELPAVPLMQGARSLTYEKNEADWTRGLRGARLDKAMAVGSLAFVFHAEHRLQAEQMFETLRKVGAPMGMFFAHAPVIVEIPSGRDYLEFIKDNPALHKCDIVICILPDNAKTRYDNIKLHTMNNLGTPSQCILVKNLESKRAMSVLTKVALQINAKLGGALWHIRSPAVQMKGLMVVGAFSTRKLNTAGDRGYSLVGTTNSQYNMFSSTMATMKGGELGNSNITNAFEELISSYREANNGASPSAILLYRLVDNDEGMDDVCSGKFEELTPIKNALAKLNPDIKLLLCVVVKRCTTRFFLGGRDNPYPGTVVDSGISHPGRYDFFLVSHSGRKEISVMPTYYFVVKDELRVPANDIQLFTHQMAHMYYNWAGTIKVPAVCQYAMKMGNMCQDIFKGLPKNPMKDKQWYL